ncbi:carbonate dehydratase [Derxia gummosa]|uniref:Carbonic anhydrase n=1 Tax=Derxia gummosa DSM 723 TaxID=1121388 RepID=A0A8B6X8Y7_9BURK|nr:carbonate dehydratase [Derxia gummosa]
MTDDSSQLPSAGDADDTYLGHLFANNRRWSKRMTDRDPEYFSRLVAQQKPRYMWIGCADSRVPANDIVDLAPGELFVHRNVANVVVHTDMNCLSTLEYAIDVLKVEHIMVVGHYGCGGVLQTLRGGMDGLADNWLRHVQDVLFRHTKYFVGLDESTAHDLLCELNVIEQARNVCRTTFVREAWKRGQKLVVHGWCYGIRDGIAHDMEFTIDGQPADLLALRDAAVARRAALTRERKTPV